MTMSPYRVLVGLDEILDTRFGTLSKIDLLAARELVKKKEYSTRVFDLFESMDARFSDKVFKDLYLKRNEETLSRSLMTDIPLIVGVGLKEVSPMFERGILEGNIEVVVNTYPYVLEDSVHKLLEAALSSFVPVDADIKIIHQDLYKLTPGVLGGVYKEWYCYDLEPWLQIHQKELLSSPMVNTKVVLAKIATSGQMPEVDDEVRCPFRARELIMRQWMDIHYIDVSAFSVNPEFRKKRQYET